MLKLIWFSRKGKYENVWDELEKYHNVFFAYFDSGESIGLIIISKCSKKYKDYIEDQF